MGKQTKHFFKMAIVLLSLLTIAACSSTSEPEDGSGGATGSGSSNNQAQTSPGSGSDNLTPEQLRAQTALEQTIFYFDFDIAEFQAEDRQTLTYHARDLAGNPNKRVRLEGHADERGTREYNLALGERRANSILNYLIVNGASRSQIDVVSYGEESPAATGSSEQSYAQNRRVELVAQ